MLRHANHTVDDVRIHYTIDGEGPALLLIHGFPQTSHSWHKVMPALAEHFTVIAPDLRGAGHSTRPRGGYDKHRLMEDLRSVVGALGFDTVSVVGHDVGAQVAYRYAAVHPDEVSNLVLMDSVVPGTRQWTALRANPRAWHINFHNARDLPEALVAGREREYVRYFITRVIIDPSKFPPEEVEVYAEAFAAPGAARAGFEYYRAMTQDEEDNQPYLKQRLKTRTLMLGGKVSTSGPVQQEMINEIVESPKFVQVEDCGHWLNEEAPDEVVRILLDFLGRK
jgi:pimeloyl-ACP methyl ester carboxylesterase